MSHYRDTQLQVAENYKQRVNSYSAVIDFSRQNLTTKVDPRTIRVKIFLKSVYP